MRRISACALAAAALAAGCGNERVDSASVLDAKVGKGTRVLSYPDAGLRVNVPKEFDVRPASAPQLFRASFGAAFISSFAYRRKERIPRTGDELAAARRRLVAAATRRDKTFHLTRSRVTEVGGAPAIELLGDQTIFKGRLRLRSLHVYKGNGEYVVELVAPVAAFGALERSTFPVIQRSLRVTGEVKEKSGSPKPGSKRSEEPSSATGD